MGWIVSNWVQRRAATEQNLRNSAEVWKRAQATIAEACDSFRQLYPTLGTISEIQPTSDVLLITLERGAAGKTDCNIRTLVSLEFLAGKPSIVVRLDHQNVREFPIGADSDHAFLVLQGNELVWDEFSRLTLEQAFFPSEPSSRSLLSCAS